MSTITSVPLTVGSPLADLRAAATAPPEPPATPPVIPVESGPPPPFTIAEADGKVTVTLKTGQKYEGATEREALARLAEAQVSASERIHELSTAPPVPSEPPPPDAEAEMAEIVWDLIGKSMGMTGEQVKSEMRDLSAFKQKVADANMAHEFAQSCPDFPGTEEAQQALYRYMGESGMVTFVQDGVDEAGKPKGRAVGETAAKLRAAHAACLREGLYKGLTPEEQKAALGTPVTAPNVPKPPPIPPLSGSQTADSGGIGNPFAMPVNELREWVKEELKKGR